MPTICRLRADRMRTSITATIEPGAQTVFLSPGLAASAAALAEDAHFFRGLLVAAALRDFRAALVGRQRVGSSAGGRQRPAECLPRGGILGIETNGSLRVAHGARRIAGVEVAEAKASRNAAPSPPWRAAPRASREIVGHRGLILRRSLPGYGVSSKNSGVTVIWPGSRVPYSAARRLNPKMEHEHE
jgi:hypothetical protein